MSDRTCSAQNCVGPIKARGLCNAHYLRWRKNADQPRCVADGCGKAKVARGWCNAHYKLWSRGKMLGDGEDNRQHRGACSLNGCERVHFAKGLCHLHYSAAQPSSASTVDP